MNVKKEYISMLVHTAERECAKKEALDPLTTAALLSQAATLPMNVANGMVKGVGQYGIPLAILWYFTKYIGIPTVAGYAAGHSLAKSTSTSKDDLKAAENNALAKETVRRTQALKDMPTVNAEAPTGKDLMAHAGGPDFGSAYDTNY